MKERGEEMIKKVKRFEDKMQRLKGKKCFKNMMIAIRAVAAVVAGTAIVGVLVLFLRCLEV